MTIITTPIRRIRIIACRVVLNLLYGMDRNIITHLQIIDSMNPKPNRPIFKVDWPNGAARISPVTLPVRIEHKGVWKKNRRSLRTKDHSTLSRRNRMDLSNSCNRKEKKRKTQRFTQGRQTLKSTAMLTKFWKTHRTLSWAGLANLTSLKWLISNIYPALHSSRIILW